MTLNPCSSSWHLTSQRRKGRSKFLSRDQKSWVRVFLVTGYFSVLSVLSPCLALQIIFHKENPGIDYEFYIPVEKKERERETARERPREREPARAPFRSTSIALQLFVLSFVGQTFWQLHVPYSSTDRQDICTAQFNLVGDRIES